MFKKLTISLFALVVGYTLFFGIGFFQSFLSIKLPFLQNIYSDSSWITFLIFASIEILIFTLFAFLFYKKSGNVLFVVLLSIGYIAAYFSGLCTESVFFTIGSDVQNADFCMIQDNDINNNPYEESFGVYNPASKLNPLIVISIALIMLLFSFTYYSRLRVLVAVILSILLLVLYNWYVTVIDGSGFPFKTYIK